MKRPIDYIDIEKQIKDAGAQSSDEVFAAKIMKAVGAPDATIKRSDFKSLDRGVTFGKRLFLRKIPDGINLYKALDTGNQTQRRVCRIMLYFNSSKVYAVDTVDNSALSCNRSNLYEHAEFFFPAAGRERESISEQQKLDAKIGDKVASLSNELKIENPGTASNSIYDFITSMVLLFILEAYFGLIKNGKTLTNYLETRTNPDGTDLGTVLLSITKGVNGSEDSSDIKALDPRLYNDPFPPLQFSNKARKILLELSGLSWSDVQSYVPGAILQSLTAENQTSLTDNYLSRTNVLRLIGPLFIDALRSMAEQVRSSEEYDNLMSYLMSIYVLNPDSSSGDCLIGCIDELNTVIEAAALVAEKEPTLFPLDHLIGIEPDSTAVGISRISLCLSVLSWSTRFGKMVSPKEAVDVLYSHQIINASSLSVDWDKLCPASGKVFILGNTQYVGARMRSDTQTAEFDRIFAGLKDYRDIDYSGAYLYAAAKYMQHHDAEAAFIVTNSVTQGSQAGTLWPFIFDLGMHISFAWQSFKLKNMGRRLTAVTVVVVGIAKNISARERTLFVRSDTDTFEETHPASISPYLVPGDNIIKRRSSPIGNGFPKMVKGNMAYTKLLILTPEEKANLIRSYPEANKYIRFCNGSDETLNGLERYCLYIRDEGKDEALMIPPIAERVNQVRLERANNKDANARKLAKRPWAFREENQTTVQSIVVPAVSSENYVYIPMDIVGPETIVTNLAFVIYDTDEWILGVLMSRMHNVWIKTVCGGLETRIRYSNVLGYNTFPFPEISETKKQQIRNCVADIFAAREAMVGKTLAQKYKKGQMSKELEASHQRLDMVIDGCYQSKPFPDDESRLYKLFELYEESV